MQLFSVCIWKHNFCFRYTANDPCNPRCWLLYKDHYHCNVDKCFNAFKSKDGVRDHARLHDNQEKISEQLYTAYDVKDDCGVSECDYRKKAYHFHCKWVCSILNVLIFMYYSLVEFWCSVITFALCVHSVLLVCEWCVSCWMLAMLKEYNITLFAMLNACDRDLTSSKLNLPLRSVL